MSNQDPTPFDDADDDFDDRFDDEIEDEYEDDDDDLDDDDLDDDDLDDDDLDDELDAYFAGDDYEIVELASLIADNLAESELALPEPPSAIELAELMRRLREYDDLPPWRDLAVLGNLPPSARDQLRMLWPATPVAKRRAVLEALTDAYDADVPLDLNEILRLALDDVDADVRTLAVLSLAEEARPDYLGRLAHLVRHDADSAVRAAAAAVLGNYVLAGELDELDPALAMRAEEALMAALADPNEVVAVQCNALESIAFSGEVGVRQLIEDAYYSPDEDLRLSALTAMGRSADVRWRNLARAELSNPSPAMRAAAAFAVGELEATAALPEVLELVEDEEQLVRLAAIEALGHLGGREARLVLQRIVNSGDETEVFVAEEALEAMAFFASDEAQNAPLYGEGDEDDDDEDWRFAANVNLGDYN